MWLSRFAISILSLTIHAEKECDYILAETVISTLGSVGPFTLSSLLGTGTARADNCADLLFNNELDRVSLDTVRSIQEAITNLPSKFGERQAVARRVYKYIRTQIRADEFDPKRRVEPETCMTPTGNYLRPLLMWLKKTGESVNLTN